LPRYAVWLAAVATASCIGCAKDREADQQAATAPSAAPPSTTAAASAAATATASGADEERSEAGGNKQRRNAPAPTTTPPADEKAERRARGAAAAPPGPVTGGEQKAIDPNGRFATTYRPGRGFLSGFEAALARGGVPQPARELVADVGSLYSPEITLKPERAVSVRTDLERAKLPPTGGPFHLRVALRSTPERGAPRPKLAVHLVLDTSGSMQGEPIRRAREAAEALVDKLEPTDEFSLTTFASGAEVRVPAGTIAPRKAAIHAAIRALKEGGNTDIGEGLRKAYGEALRGAFAPSERGTERDDVVPLVLLVSDGKPTSGLRTPRDLGELSLRAFQAGVQTSAFGLGSAFDGPLMSAVAGEGAGAYYYLRDATEMRGALATEIDRRVDPVATALEVRVWLEPEVELLHAYGSQRLDAEGADRVRRSEIAADRQAAKRDGIDRDRRDDIDGGMRFYIPAFARDDQHSILLKLRAPAKRPSPLRVGVVEVKYKDRVFGKNVFDDATIWAPYADTVGESSASLDRSVSRTVHGFAAGEALTGAAARLSSADREGATALLATAESQLRQAADALDEPAFVRDADRFARFRAQPAGSGSPLLLSMILETAGRSRLQ
jgi:Ca-activated chloride channel family protein